MLKFLWITTTAVLIASCDANDRNARAIDSAPKKIQDFEGYGYDYPPPSQKFTLPPRESQVIFTTPIKNYQPRPTSVPQNIVNSNKFSNQEKVVGPQQPIKSFSSNVQQPLSSGQASIGYTFQNQQKPAIQQSIISRPSTSLLPSNNPLTQKGPLGPAQQSFGIIYQNQQKPSSQQASISRPSTSLIPSNNQLTQKSPLGPAQQSFGIIYQNQQKPSSQQPSISRPSTSLIPSNNQLTQKSPLGPAQQSFGIIYQNQQKPSSQQPSISRPSTSLIPTNNQLTQKGPLGPAQQSFGSIHQNQQKLLVQDTLPNKQSQGYKYTNPNTSESSGYVYPKPEKTFTLPQPIPTKISNGFPSPRPSGIYSTTKQPVRPIVTQTPYTVPKPFSNSPINRPIFTKPPPPPSPRPNFVPKQRPSSPSIFVQQNLPSYKPPLLLQGPSITSDLNSKPFINGPKPSVIQTTLKPYKFPFTNILPTTGKPLFGSNVRPYSPPNQPPVSKSSVIFTPPDSINNKVTNLNGYTFTTRPNTTPIKKEFISSTYLPPRVVEPKTTTTPTPPTTLRIIKNPTPTYLPPITTSSTTPTTTSNRPSPTTPTTTTTRPTPTNKYLPPNTTTPRTKPTTTPTPPTKPRPTTTPTRPTKPRPTTTPTRPTKPRPTKGPTPTYLPPITTSSTTPSTTTTKTTTTKRPPPTYLPPDTITATTPRTTKPPTPPTPPTTTTMRTTTPTTTDYETTKGSGYLPPHPPITRFPVTIQPPIYPSVNTEITPSTPTYPPPTGSKFPPPTLPPPTKRTIGYVYPIPDIPFYT